MVIKVIIHVVHVLHSGYICIIWCEHEQKDFIEKLDIVSTNYCNKYCHHGKFLTKIHHAHTQSTCPTIPPREPELKHFKSAVMILKHNHVYWEFRWLMHREDVTNIMIMGSLYRNRHFVYTFIPKTILSLKWRTFAVVVKAFQ